METIIDSPQNLHLASELFKTIDTNGSNSIDKEEMRRAVQSMGYERRRIEVRLLRPFVACSTDLYEGWAAEYARGAARRKRLLSRYCRERLACEK